MITLEELVRTPAENPVRELRTELIECGSDHKKYERLFTKALAWIEKTHPHLVNEELSFNLAEEMECSF